MTRLSTPGFKSGLLAVAIGMAFLLSGWCHGARRHVRVDGDDNGDGLSWATALASVQRAIDLSASGDEVWVAAGRYEAEMRREAGSESGWAMSFLLRDGVSLYGGFCGQEKSLSERTLDSTAPEPSGSWDFAAETILALPEGSEGGILVGETERFQHTTRVDGFTITGGRAFGRAEDGYGGGGLLPGNVILTRCRVIGNLARSGGGLALRSGAQVHACLIADNDLLAEGWGGLGGGIRLLGPGAIVANSVIVGNGANGEARAGGGIYAEGAVTIAACTIVGNAALRQGSGVSLAGNGGQLLNCLVWGNQGSSLQVSNNDAFISHCGITGGPTNNSNVPLEAANAGPGGVNSNDNWVDGYYVCFVDPDNRNFRLAAGSYAINRGMATTWNDDGGGDAAGQPRQQQGYADLGAYESPALGNLVYDFAVDFPCLYREYSAVWPAPGLATPEGVAIRFQDQTGLAAWQEEEDGLWSAEWLAAGQAAPGLEARMTGPAAEFWHVFSLTRLLTVRPRPLTIAADDLEYTYGEEFPAFTWSIIAGSLAAGDTLTGELACAYAGILDQSYSITQGTLRVEDGAGGANYRLDFIPGILTCHKAAATLTVTNSDHVYNGRPADFAWTSDPADLAGVITCIGIDGTVYGPSSELPVNAGTYLVTVVVDDPHYAGSIEAILHIHKAPLTVAATHCSRMFGVPNPVFELIYEGFCANDGLDDIEPPLATCSATIDSPVGDYAIVLTGGQAANYELMPQEGVMTITPAKITVSLTTTPAVYGDSLDDLTVSAVATHAITGAPVPGTLRWNDGGDAILPAGEHTCEWTFIPDDANFAAASGTAAVTIAKAPLTVQAPKLERGAGIENPALTLTYSGFIQGEDEHTPGVFARVPALVCTATADSPAGIYPIQILPGEAANYEMTYQEGWLEVCLNTPQVNSINTQNVYYGTLLSDIVLTGSFTHPVTGEAIAGTLSWEDGAELLPAGTHSRPWRFVPDNSDWYAPVTGMADIVVLPRSLVIKVNSYSKNYGENDPPFAWEFGTESMPLVDGDVLDVQVRRDAGEMPGQYELWPEVNGLNNNYTIRRIPGILTIRRLTIYVYANSQYKQFGEPDPALTYRIGGTLLEGDAFSGNLSRVAGEERGTYAINQGTLQLPEYYELKFNGARLSIIPRQLVISVKSWSKVYGDPDPAWECTVAIGSLLPGDELIGAPARNPGENVGKYAHNAGDLRVNDNYALNVRSGSVTITQRPVTVQAHDAWRFPKMPNPTFTYEITEGSIVDGDSFTGELSATETTRLGTYEIKRGTLALNENYALTYRPGVLEVITATIKDWEVAATDVTYGQKLGDSELTGTFYHPHTGEPVPGILQWTLPETMVPHPGVSMREATFTPEPSTWLDTVTLPVSLTVHRIRIKVVAESYDIIWGDQIGDGTGFKYYIAEGTMLPGDSVTGNVFCANAGNVGTYEIYLGFLKIPTYYDAELVHGTLTIRHRHLTVKADDLSKIMYHPDPTHTYTIIDGSLAGGAIFVGILYREQGETPGTYPITQGTLSISTANCILHFIGGTFTVLPMPGLRSVSADPICAGEPLSCSALCDTQDFADAAVRSGSSSTLTWASPDTLLPAGTWPQEWLRTDDAGVIIERGVSMVKVIPVQVTVTQRCPLQANCGEGQNDFPAADEAGWGIDRFASLEEALAAVAPGGEVLVEPGEYLAPAQGWIIDQSVTITALLEPSEELAPAPESLPEQNPEAAQYPQSQLEFNPSSEVILRGEVVIAGDDDADIELSGLAILAPEGRAAVRIAAKNAAVRLQGNFLSGDQAAVRIEDFTSLDLSDNILDAAEGVSAPDSLDLLPIWLERNELLAP
ncbi:MAG: hypothetical protein BWX73_00749 [Lentisphaerae bacterium ADurb.Bin082]|nr:MAG: hypothetical protein BWX73_00749 [Lentisphaerae bacterium ADurb.Bin082]